LQVIRPGYLIFATGAFRVKIDKKKMKMPMGHPSMGKILPKRLKDFYAKTNDQPIYAGFKNKVDVHAGISGKNGVEYQGIVG
jgi:hypothetical protein